MCRFTRRRWLAGSWMAKRCWYSAGQGMVRVLNPAAAYLGVDGRPAQPRGDAAAIVAEYAVDEARGRADVLAFCEDLAWRGVIVIER